MIIIYYYYLEINVRIDQIRWLCLKAQFLTLHFIPDFMVAQIYTSYEPSKDGGRSKCSELKCDMRYMFPERLENGYLPYPRDDAYGLITAAMVLLGAENDMPWFQYPSKEEYRLRIREKMLLRPLEVRNSD